MAIVANLADPTGPTLDRPYNTHNRINAGTPNAALVPAYVGEIVLDTTGNTRWIAKALTNTSWVAINPRV